MNSLVRRLAEHSRRWGFAMSLGAWLYRYCARRMGLRLFVISTREIVATPTELDPHLRIRFKCLSAPELFAMAADPSLYVHRDFVERALAQGDFCIGAFDGGKLVAYAWRSFGQAPEIDDMPGVSVRVRPPYCYTYKVFTRPEYRGRGIWPALSVSGVADRVCREAGCSQLIGFVEIDNFSSLGANHRLGAIRAGYAGYFRWRKPVWFFHSPGVVRTELRLVATLPGALTRVKRSRGTLGG